MQNTAIAFTLFFSLLGCTSGGNENQNNSLSKTVVSQPNDVLVFHRVSEPNENAFSLLAPVGWKITGGITRVVQNAVGGPANSMEAKLYMKLSSPDETAGICWLPDTRFYDVQHSPSGSSLENLFPAGSHFDGMLVMPIPDPAEFAKQFAVPFAHPHAQNVYVIETIPLPGLAVRYQELSARMIPGYSYKCTAAIVTLRYDENSIPYYEKMVCIIEDSRQPGAGMWGNRETWFVRAVAGKFEALSPIFATIGQSVHINPLWLAREVRSQQITSRSALKTQQDIENTGREICRYRTAANTEINNDMYLNLTRQGDYRNPFTGEAERGASEWNRRWENESGDVIFTDNQGYNPNEDGNINMKGFKRSEIRK